MVVEGDSGPALPTTLLEALLAEPPAASARGEGAVAAVAAAVVVPEEGGDEEEEGGEEVLPSAWDPSDWWGEDEEAAARAQTHSGSSSSSSAPAPIASLEHEALSSRRPPPHPQPPPLPRPWNPEGSGAYHASLSADRLTARYVGRGANHGQDVGAVKADRPLPRTRDCYYFEVRGWVAFSKKAFGRRYPILALHIHTQHTHTQHR